MQITETRISFVQVEFLGAVLRARNPTSIPFSFLLSGPLFQAQYQQAVGYSGNVDIPWATNGYAGHFWRYYTQDREGPKQYWRALVPLEYKLSVKVCPSWSGDGIAKAYLYPWGIGVLLEVSLKGKWSDDDAVSKAQDIRWLATASLQPGNQSAGQPANQPGGKLLTDLMGALLESVRHDAYGVGTRPGTHSGLFTIVTVLEGEGAANTAIVGGSPEHKRLEALVGWNTQWKNLNLNPLANSTIEIKSQAPLAHILYGNRRGRAVWFPEYFKSVTHDDRLLIYHQNLTMASLQTESLCQLAKDVSRLLDENDPVAQWSVAYGDCAQFAAGLLGHLYGGTLNTYRSNSIRHQIQSSYVDAVDALRLHFKMTKLS